MTAVEYKLLLLDLDGTLIGRDSLISPRVVDAVGKVSGRLQTSIATGREPPDVIRFAGELGLTGPQISDNGAMILDPVSEQTLWTAPLPPGSAADVLARLAELRFSLIATHPGGTASSVPEADGKQLTRISALDVDEWQADQLVADFASQADLDSVKVFLPYNGMWAVDFTMAGVNKATAARRLARLAGVDASQIIAAGDSYNDLPLFEASGLCIAMADAPDELKDLADYTAPTVDEDGLAVAIEEFVMPRIG